MSQTSTARQWSDLKATLQQKLSESYSQLDRAASSATETLDDRVKKVHGPLAEILMRCRQSVELNLRSANLQKTFILAQLETVDQLIADTSNRLVAAVANTELEEFAQNSASALVGPVIVSTTKMAFEALCLCSLLAGTLGHKEANAFVQGAQEELVGAISDPGAGVLTLLKRAYAVGTRTLRKDQDAAELLASLAAFEDYLGKWRSVAGEMAQGTPFPRALEIVFKDAAKA